MPASPARSGRGRAIRLALALLIGLATGRIAEAAAEAAAAAGPHCPDPSPRFELFALEAPLLGRPKQIWVYLPPGYACAAPQRYPVFYFNDGHDLFDWNPFAADLDPATAADIAAREGWYGSWHLEGQLDRAIEAGALPPLIAVGIASDDGMRSRDLAPGPWRGSREGWGARYARFVAGTVVPAADRRYRTVADRRCRGIGGASLGGVSALHIGLTHPGTFGLVLAFSPVLGDPAIAEALAAAYADAEPAGRSALLVDFDDDAIGAADRAWLASLVEPTGHAWLAVTLTQTPGGRHHIASWAQRLVPALAMMPLAPCAAATK